MRTTTSRMLLPPRFIAQGFAAAVAAAFFFPHAPVHAITQSAEGAQAAAMQLEEQT